MSGIKGQDIVVLLKLACLQDQRNGRYVDESVHHGHFSDPYSVRNLEIQLGISKTEVNASIKRSLFSGLALRSRSSGHVQPHRRSLQDFIVYGLKYVFPVKPGGMVRGVPTGFDAPMLYDKLGRGGEYIHVWPSATGEMIGQAVAPLFKSVPDAVRSDALLYEYLALIDAIRLGGQRESSLAANHLSQRLLLS